MFYVIEGPGDNEELHLKTLAAVVAEIGRDGGPKVVEAWLQDERDPTPPGEARYQRRRYITP